MKKKERVAYIKQNSESVFLVVIFSVSTCTESTAVNVTSVDQPGFHLTISTLNISEQCAIKLRAVVSYAMHELSDLSQTAGASAGFVGLRLYILSWRWKYSELCARIYEHSLRVQVQPSLCIAN